MKFRKVRLPQDGSAHKNIIEWWYFNGHLQDASGRRYSFMDCLFQADLKRVELPLLKAPFRKSLDLPYIYFSHSVVSDLVRKKSYKDIQNISLLSGDSFRRPLLYANYFNPLSLSDGYVNCEMVETEPFRFHIKNSRIDLSLVSRKPPLLEGGRGFIDVCGRKSYYYSLTDLAAVGTINVAGRTVKVSGRAWMDHQWADVAYSRDAWSWFSLQLSDGTDIMCVEYRVGEQRDYSVDIIDAQGRTSHYDRLILKTGRQSWKSAKTKAEYPLEWEIDIPDQRISLKTKATMRDQEMIFGAINYWEGPLSVSGSVGHKKVSGVGFMELVGYKSDYNFIALAGQALNHKIGRAIFAKVKKIML